MIKDSYKILGVDEYCTDRELSEAYFSLRKKYQEDRFLDGEAGNEAARKLTELDAAYEEVSDFRKEHSSGENASLYKEVDAAIKSDDLAKAQELLDSFNERPAEWHYLQAVVFYRKNWMNESKKQLEIAKNLDPDNEKYKTTYDKLVKKIEDAGKKADPDWNRSGSGRGTRGSYDYGDGEPQMGGDSCMSYCCQLLWCNMLLNCCCNSCR